MTTTQAESPTLLPPHAWIAMQQFTPAEQKTVTDFLSYLEVVIGRHATGRTGESRLSYFLNGGDALWIGEELTASVQDTTAAWWKWVQAETGDYDVHSLEPELQDEEVYAERCRAELDDELANLAGELAR